MKPIMTRRQPLPPMPCLLSLLLLVLPLTFQEAAAFVPPPWHAATNDQPYSSSLLHVLRDFRSTRLVNHSDQNIYSDDDDDVDVDAYVNGWSSPPSLSFSELLLPHEPKANGRYKQISSSSSSTKARFVAETDLPTPWGLFRLRAYTTGRNAQPVLLEPCVIYAADKPPMRRRDEAPVPIRVHDQCITSEVFGSLRCDCNEQLQMSLEYIQQHGGCLIYLQQEGRGIGLANKIAAYALQDVGLDTVDANVHLGFAEDCREYTVIPSILQDMGLHNTEDDDENVPIELLTNNPRKVRHLTKLGINVVGTRPIVVPNTTPHNYQYMATKVERMQHDNLAPLLKPRNGVVAPINGHMAPLVPPNHPMDGVQASADGYCFGRQSVEDAIAAIGRGELIVVVDDLDRENEGDFIMAADLCTAADMGQIVKYSSGVVCIALEEERLEALELPAMVQDNQDPKGTAFTVTVDATKEHGITTGISAADRATTMRLLADPASAAIDFHRPGHVLPLKARPGGVLTRNGHTEAAIDLAKLAGRAPAGVLCELVSEDDPTEMMRLPEIQRFCRDKGYVLTSIADLQQYRRETEL